MAAQPFSTLALADVAGPELERIERSSSLVGSRGFVALKPGESLQFDVPAGHRLGALAVNAVKSFGYLEITHGDGVVHKDVRFGETAINPLNNIVLKVVPMLARVGSGPCRLRLLDRAPDAEIEPTIPASAPVVDREPGLEMASVVFIRDDQPAPDDGGQFQLELKAPGGHAATGEAASAAPVATVKFSYTEDDALNYGVVELLREMGRLLIDLNRPKEADHFLTRAQSLRPNGPTITHLVELARSLEKQHPG